MLIFFIFTSNVTAGLKDETRNLADICVADQCSCHPPAIITAQT